MKYLFQNFPLAIILMIAILIMLFKDYRKPIIIFCCIPMIFVGVVAVMLLTGKVFNFVAIVGTLGLIGMLIKNGIVLMDEITLQINEGVEPITALIDSSQSRLRPVMMASLTTILGMIPLLSDAMFGSLAAAIMGGLLCSTLITLLFGALAGNVLPVWAMNGFSVMLYGMFLAIIMPEGKKNRVVLGCIGVSFVLSGLAARLLPMLSSGMRILLLTIFISAAAAILFPREASEEAGAKASGEEAHAA